LKINASHSFIGLIPKAEYVNKQYDGGGDDQTAKHDRHESPPDEDGVVEPRRVLAVAAITNATGNKRE
jgi:hypothetical protein